MNSWTPDERGIVRLWDAYPLSVPARLTNPRRWVTFCEKEDVVVDFYTRRYTPEKARYWQPPRARVSISDKADGYARFQFEAEQETRLEFGLPLLRDADAEQREEWHKRFMAELEAEERAARRRGWKNAALEDDFLEVLEFEDLCDKGALER